MEGAATRSWLAVCIASAIVCLLAIYKGGTEPMALSIASVMTVAMLVVAPGKWLHGADQWRWLVMPLAVIVTIAIHAVWLNPEGRTRAYFECVAWFGIGFGITFVTAHATPRMRRMIVAIVAALVLFQVIYGFAEYLRGSRFIFGRWERGADVLTGTFVNRNHVADVISAGSLVVIGSIIQSRVAIPVRVAIAGCLWVGCALAVIATQSRLGLIALIAGSLVLAFASSAPLIRRRPISAAGVALALLLAAGLWFGPGALLERFAGLFAAEDRKLLWSHLLSQPMSTWLQGIGPGQFEDVFKTLSPATLTRSYPEAHNDYLEFVFEFGVMGTIIVLLGASVTLAGRWGRGHHYAPAWAGLMVFAIHAAGDFPLQVPGSAALFWLILGLALAPLGDRQRRSND